MKILWAKCNDAFLLRSDVTLLPTARLPRANNAGRFCTFKKSQKKGATTVTWFFRFGVSSARCPRASEKNTTHAAHPTRVPPPPAVLLLRIPNHQNKFRKYFASDLGYLPTFQEQSSPVVLYYPARDDGRRRRRRTKADEPPEENE
jgi:hypothetical protein